MAESKSTALPLGYAPALTSRAERRSRGGVAATGKPCRPAPQELWPPPPDPVSSSTGGGAESSAPAADHQEGAAAANAACACSAAARSANSAKQVAPLPLIRASSAPGN